ncbi:MAG: chitobiase/beta-hexosaminidase C-terminal domain-containing protein [Candidatus Syntrophosphaera sp.]
MAFSCSEHTTELIQLDPPEFNPDSGEYYSGQAVTITAPEYGASIHYTVNGSEPTLDSDLYDSEDPLIIPNFFPAGENSVTLKAKAFKDGFDPSETAQAEYTVLFFNDVSTPHISPLSGDITTQTEIEIYCTTLNAEIYYTLDGSDPTQDSTLFEDTFTISQTGEVTLKARAFRPNWNPSEIASADYNVSAP